MGIHLVLVWMMRAPLMLIVVVVDFFFSFDVVCDCAFVQKKR